MLGGLLVPDDPEEVVAILLPLSLPVLLKPNAEWFKLPIKGFLKGLDGVGSTKRKHSVKLGLRKIDEIDKKSTFMNCMN